MSDHESWTPGLGHNMPPDEVEETPEQRLAKIDPERLVVVPTAEIAPLLDVHYPDLRNRAAAILGACHQWQEDHKTPAGGWIGVKDDAENAELADLIRQVDDFCAEVDEARKKVKLSVFEAGQVIDSWFRGSMALPVEEIRGVARTVSGKRYAPGPGTMQFSQTQYLAAKAERERQAREAAAKAARMEAEQKIQEARRVAAEEAARQTALRAEGYDRETAKEISQALTDQVAAAADAAVESSALIGSRTAAPIAAAVRQHTAMGTTIGLASNWTFEVTDMRQLCLAIGAKALTSEEFINKVAVSASIGATAARVVLHAVQQIMEHGGDVSENFVTTDDKVIRAAIKARTSPLRECPGLRIYQETSARRRGG